MGKSSKKAAAVGAAPVPIKVPKKAPAAKIAKQESSDDDSSDATSESDETGKKESSSDEGSEDELDDDDDDDEPAKKAAAKPLGAVAKNGLKKKASKKAAAMRTKPAAPLKKPSVIDAQKKKEDPSESDSDDDSDEEVPPKSKASVVATKKEDSSGSESESDSEVEDASKTQPAKRAASKMKDESSDDSDTDEDEKPPQKKQKEAPSAAKNGSSSEDEDGSSEESSDDERTKVEQKKAPKASASSGSEDESSEDDSDEDSEEPANTPKKPKTPMGSQNEANGGGEDTFYGKRPLRAEFDDVKEFFADAGEVVDVRFPTHEDGNRKGFCYVEFVSAEAAEKAFKEKQSKELQGREVRLDFAKGRNTQTPPMMDLSRSQFRGSNNSIFIRGFDKNLAEDEIRSALQQHFAECGDITRVSILTDYESGAIKGMAYMDFKDQDSVSKAIELSGSDIGGGYELYVDEAKPKAMAASVVVADLVTVLVADSVPWVRRGGGGRFGDRSGGRDGGGRFGGRRGGRDGGRGDGGGGRGFGNRQSAGTPSAGRIHPVLVKITAFWFEQHWAALPYLLAMTYNFLTAKAALSSLHTHPLICTGKKTTFGDD
ncbi:unnamed protein product [Miscanthus lutarioriparius]|uniref:RRM domain-containing protein n=1 Tax=Miscanthus lutarioriparius TaxID=422564 RepID=A0A811PN81_9POAL|nr:unnamed protein product [Miscanthus lutarioriparius]